jgi:hypothetical protein
MVYYFKARPEVGDYVIYMGLDKHENEDLIKYGLPEDIWSVSPSFSALPASGSLFLLFWQLRVWRFFL